MKTGAVAPVFLFFGEMRGWHQMYGLALCLPNAVQPQELPVPHEIQKHPIIVHHLLKSW